MERGEAALREQRPRRAERPPKRRAAADRDHLRRLRRARSAIPSPPPCRRRRSRPARRTRAARTRARRPDARSAARGPDGPSRRARARTARRRPARSRRRRRGSAPRAAARSSGPSRFARGPPLRARRTRRRPGDSGSPPTATSGRSEPVRIDSRTARPGNARRGEMAVRLGAHPPLPDTRRAPPPDFGRIGVRAEDGDLLGLEPAVPQGGERGECRQPTADDGTPRRRLHRYFTEPASRP